MTTLNNRFENLLLDCETDDSNIKNSPHSPAIAKSKRKKRHGRRKASEQPSTIAENIVQENDEQAPCTDQTDVGALQPRGLQNYKNSCYLNVCLQTLLHIPSVYRLILSAPKKYVSSSQLLKDGSLCQLLTDIVQEYMHVKTGHSNHSTASSRPSSTEGPKVGTKGIRPVDLGQSITPDLRFARLFGMDDGFQQDGVECLNRMLSQFHEELAAAAATTAEQTQTPSGQSVGVVVEEDDSDWVVTDRTGKRRPEARKIELHGGDSPIATLFSGTLINRNTVSLSKSQDTGRNATCHSSKEPFFILPLELEDKKIISVQSALSRLYDSEEITDYQDTTTGTNSPVTRRLRIDKLPAYLLLQLKRFSYGPRQKGLSNDNERQSSASVSWVVEKSLKMIAVPEGLVIPTKLLNPEHSFTMDQRRYTLHAVIFHVGLTATSGHYTVAIRQPENLEHTDNATESPRFLYLDDTRACLVEGREASNLLLSSHRPLDASAGVYRPVYRGATTPGQAGSIQLQPRTPYLLVYQAVHIPSLDPIE